MVPIKVSVAKLAELIKPFSFIPPEWGKKVISKTDVDNALFRIDLLAPEKKIRSRLDHIRRIAYYTAYGFGSPIKLKVTSSGKVEVVEGQHQLRAAIVRGDSLVKITVDGDPKHLGDLIPN